MHKFSIRNLLTLVLSGIIVITLVSFPSVAVSNTPGGIVLITWDGTQKETVQQLLEDGKLEHLSSILEKGSWINISITRHYPDSMASRAEILTGYSPMITGVHRSMAYGEIPKNLTIFERLKNVMGSDSVSTAVVTSKKGSVGTSKGLPFVNARGFIDHLWDSDADAMLAGSIGVETLYSIDVKRPFFLYIQLKDASQAASAYTIGSKQYMDAIIRNDIVLGMILDAITDLRLSDEVTVYVTTDHGFGSGSGSGTGETGIWMVADKPGYQSEGDQRDIIPTILDGFGLNYSIMEPVYEGISLIISDRS